MKFGPVPLAEAEGAILAHSLSVAGRQIRKGRVLTAADVAAIADAGIAEVIAARLDPDDVPEDRAATRAASGLAGSGIAEQPAYTGRVNLHAEAAGLLVVDGAAVGRLNALDESITLATLPPLSLVEAGRMVATVKVIPLAAPESVVAAWQAAGPALRLARLRPHRVALIQTMLPTLKPSVYDKTARVTRERVEALGSHLIGERRVPHQAEAVAAAVREVLAEGASLILIAGASAIIDRRDVVPAGVVEAGGRIRHFGMPVDPGNLLLLAEIGAVPVLGMPGCARSPKLNGFDWVLERLVADLPVGPEEIAGMGVGGLLGEIPSRGLPREAAGRPAVPRVAAIVLAAGRSSRMGSNKLLIEIDGRALVERAVDAALASRASSVIVVL
ncbi:MAG TPA: NTP transferase domain-containing protein, partial [Stellaceae bacterium]|nr:NTP transferase domain-containing protein [Stellaceae bacterium]